MSEMELSFQQCRRKFSMDGVVPGRLPQRSQLPHKVPSFQTTQFSEGGLSSESKNDFTRLSSRVRGGSTSLYVTTVVTWNPKAVSLVNTSLRAALFASGSLSFSEEQRG